MQDAPNKAIVNTCGCLQGAWKPALNISTLLTTIQLLMAEPNPDDPLMTDIVSTVTVSYHHHLNTVIRT